MNTKALAIAALLAPASACTQVSPGVFESDVHIRAKPASEKGFSGVSHHLLQNLSGQYVEKILHDYNNIQIFSKIYIGSERQEFDFIFDTGSSWVWVATDKCDSCVNPNKFHYNDSTTFKQVDMRQSNLHYGMGSVYGFDTTDQICLASDSKIGSGCMKDYLFKSVTH
jgi:hypothetical protein